MSVVQIVWFACWDCDLDGMYPKNETIIACPDCGGNMLQIHKPPIQDWCHDKLHYKT